MVDLTLQPGSPFGTEAPIGASDHLSISPRDLKPLLAIAPYPGREREVAAVLADHPGLSLPPQGRWEGASGARIVWSEADTWVLEAAAPQIETVTQALCALALCRDCSGGWAAVSLAGAAASSALARLSPLDTRPVHFEPGRVARTEIAHLSGLVLSQTEGFEIWVPRSYARFFWKKLQRAAQDVVSTSALR